MLGLVAFVPLVSLAACGSGDESVFDARTSVCGITEHAANGAQETGIAVGHYLLWVDDARLAEDLDAIAATGTDWIRIDINWPSTEPVQGTYDWRAPDRLVNAARSRGLDVLGVIAYTPTWARPALTSDKHPPSDPQEFGRFSGAVAARYAGAGVDHFEIWNEPNTVDFWQSGPDPARYAALLNAGFTAIKAANPSAKVISGGLAPAADRPDGLTISPNTFVAAMYAAGAKNTFDALGMHPYSYPDMPTAAVHWNPFAGLPATRDVMVANGDGAKAIWGTEYGAPTGRGARAVSEDVQAAMVTEAYGQWSTWSSWTGPLFWYSNRDIGTNAFDLEHNFGMIAADGRPKPAHASFVAVNAGAAQPAAPSAAPVPAPGAEPSATSAPAATKAPRATTAPTTTSSSLSPSTTTTAPSTPGQDEGTSSADLPGSARVECE